MRAKSSHKTGKHLSWAITFLCLLFLIIVGSFLWKAILFLGNSSFDGSHQFTLAVVGDSPHVISFNPDEGSVTNVSVAPENQQIGKGLLIPIDAQVQGEGDNIAHILFGAFFHHSGTLSPVDDLKLWWFVQTLSKDSVTTVSLATDDQQKQQQIPRIFQDKSMYSEGKSITIVNATGVSGLGSRLAKLLTNIGANVIMVSTADKDLDTSQITYSGSTSYTVLRLGKILHLSPTNTTSSHAISDITITIGKNMVENDIF